MKNARVGLPTTTEPLKVNLKTKLRDLTISPIKPDVLFTSIDGVFHPSKVETLERIKEFTAFFESNKSFRMVITSHWRCEMDTDFFEDNFAPIMPFILGFTPLLPSQKNRREAEILAFAKHFKCNSMGILDSNAERFDKLKSLVVVPDRYTGISREDLVATAKNFNKSLSVIDQFYEVS